MGDQVSWQVELAVRSGELDKFRALTEEMVESARDEPGVLSYERFVSEDGQVVHVYERYADAAAAVARLRTFGRNFGGRFRAWSTANGSPYTVPRVRSCGGCWTSSTRHTWGLLAVSPDRVPSRSGTLCGAFLDGAEQLVSEVLFLLCVLPCLHLCFFLRFLQCRGVCGYQSLGQRVRGR